MIPKELNIAPIPPSHILPPISTSRSIPAEKIIDGEPIDIFFSTHVARELVHSHF